MMLLAMSYSGQSDVEQVYLERRSSDDDSGGRVQEQLYIIGQRQHQRPDGRSV